MRDLERTRTALGDGVKRPYASETGPLNKMIKRIVAARHLRAGTVLTADDLAFRIPDSSKIAPEALQPCEVDGLIGKVLKRDIAVEELVTYDFVGAGRQVA